MLSQSAYINFISQESDKQRITYVYVLPFPISSVKFPFFHTSSHSTTSCFGRVWQLGRSANGENRRVGCRLTRSLRLHRAADVCGHALSAGWGRPMARPGTIRGAGDVGGPARDEKGLDRWYMEKAGAGRFSDGF